MAGIITVPLHIGDFLSGTMHMDATEKGAYIMLLLSHYQVGEQGLPDDDKQLARIAGVSGKVWSRIRPVMAAKFTIENSFWVNSKTVDTLRKVAQLRSQNSAKALKRYSAGDAAAVPQQCQPKPKPNIISKDIIARPADVSQSVWDDFVKHRKAVKAPLTETALNGINREAVKAGIPMEDALREICARGWRGFKAEWMEKEQGKPGKSSDVKKSKLVPVTDALLKKYSWRKPQDGMIVVFENEVEFNA